MLCSLFGVKALVLAVTKLDTFENSKGRFDQVKASISKGLKPFVNLEKVGRVWVASFVVFVLDVAILLNCPARWGLHLPKKDAVFSTQ